MEYIVRVNSSSSPSIYNIVFRIDNGVTSVNCDCKAGLLKTLCKHRLNLLAGDSSQVCDELEATYLNSILGQINMSKIENLSMELEAIELEMKKLDLMRKELRKEFGTMLSKGF